LRLLLLPGCYATAYVLEGAPSFALFSEGWALTIERRQLSSLYFFDWP
jgi:hypothetical protein